MLFGQDLPHMDGTSGEQTAQVHRCGQASCPAREASTQVTISPLYVDQQFLLIACSVTVNSSIFALGQVLYYL